MAARSMVAWALTLLCVISLPVHTVAASIQAPQTKVNVATVEESDIWEIGLPSYLRRLLANTTTVEAFAQLPRDLPEDLRSYLMSAFPPFGVAGEGPASMTSFRPQVFLQARTAHATTHKAVAVEEARKALNQLAEASQNKLDAEKARCASLCANQAQVIEDARNDINDLGSQGTAAAENLMAARRIIEDAEDRMPRLAELVDAHKAKCSADQENRRSQMEAVMRDAKTLQEVLGMSQCAEGSSTTLLECKDRSDERGTIVEFRHAALEKHLENLKTAEVRRRLRETLAEAAGARLHRARRVPRAGHRHRHHILERDEGQHRRHFAEEGEVASAEGMDAGVFLQASQNQTRFHRQPLGVAERERLSRIRTRCSVRSVTSCDTLRAKFMNMQVEVEDKVDNMKDALAEVVALCHTTELSLQAQVSEVGSRLREAQTKLAEATERQIQASEASRLKARQMAELEDEGRRMHRSCGDTFKQLAKELCGIRQIRQELYKMDRKSPFIQDCEVSEWTPEECSATCGGGEQTLHRKVISQPQLGASCPALVMVRKCAEHPCPVDCQLEDWSGWSACTSRTPCVPGVKERTRAVVQHAEHHGAPCQATTQSMTCNSEACDRDCELAQWTEWSNCSKACDGGFKMRERIVVQNAVGEGQCPDEDHSSRRQYLRCLANECTPTTGNVLKCASKIDVVLLLDGSGTIGEEGWEAIRSAAANIVQAFKGGADGAQMAVLLFAGPSSPEAYARCRSGNGTADPVTDCKTIWVSHWTADPAVVSSQFASLKWPKGPSVTAPALAAVKTELLLSRADVDSVVIVLTSGRTKDRSHTERVVKELRQTARVIWVAASRRSDLDSLKRWASRPVADNLLVLDGFDKLALPSTTNHIVADACPLVE